MILKFKHPDLGVECAVDIEKVLSGAGLSPEDVARCFPTVPKDLVEEVVRSTEAINAFVHAWADAPAIEKPTVPTWVVSIRAL